MKKITLAKCNKVIISLFSRDDLEIFRISLINIEKYKLFNAASIFVHNLIAYIKVI